MRGHALSMLTRADATQVPNPTPPFVTWQGEPFIQGAPPFLALRLRTTAAPSAIECPVRGPKGDSPLAQVPLVGVCSDMPQRK